MAYDKKKKKTKKVGGSTRVTKRVSRGLGMKGRQMSGSSQKQKTKGGR